MDLAIFGAKFVGVVDVKIQKVSSKHIILLGLCSKKISSHYILVGLQIFFEAVCIIPDDDKPIKIFRGKSLFRRPIVGSIYSKPFFVNFLGFIGLHF